MRLTVEGTVTSIEVKSKNDKTFTELLLAQDGQKEQVTIRLDGDLSANYDRWTMEQFTGRLMTWATRNGVGSMVMVDA